MHDKWFWWLVAVLALVILGAVGINAWTLRIIKRRLRALERKALNSFGVPTHSFRSFAEQEKLWDEETGTLRGIDARSNHVNWNLYGEKLWELNFGLQLDAEQYDKLAYGTELPIEISLPEYVERMLDDYKLELHPWQRLILAKFFEDHPDADFEIDVNNVDASDSRKRNEVPRDCPFCSTTWLRADEDDWFRHMARSHPDEVLRELEKSLTEEE
jgi:hypothetical protein